VSGPPVEPPVESPAAGEPLPDEPPVESRDAGEPLPDEPPMAGTPDGPTVAAPPKALASTRRSRGRQRGRGRAIIETRGLTKVYGEDLVAVDHLDLRIAQGEIFGLLGPNGAGKTTTILMLLGLTEPTAGTATVDGLTPQREALAVKRRVGYLPDDVGFYDEMTGRQNLRYTARLNRLPRDEGERVVAALLNEVGLGDAADRKVRGYSRGMRQRLGLADALVKSPSVLVLDEPTVNIDPEGVREILQLVRRLRDERGVTILLASHLLHQVEQVCDRIGIFLAGRLAAVGTLEKLAAGVDDRWIVEVAAAGVAPGDLAREVATVPGVNGIEREGDLVLAMADHDLLVAIGDRIADAGWKLTHLRRRGADLDAIYHRYFTGATP
jgi:ABC-2 type transport system ATP-binding protein